MRKPGPRARRKKGKIFVVSAPSGCGKTTLCNKLLEESPGLANSISMTTRPPRPGERDGIDYRFVSRRRFNVMIRSGGFLEYEDNFGHLYGTPRRFVEENIKKGKSVLLSIDVKGAMKVKSSYPRGSVLVFLLPPSIKELRARLYKRKSDDRESIAKRLTVARREIGYKDRYDHRIINDNLVTAYRKLENIVESELENQ